VTAETMLEISPGGFLRAPRYAVSCSDHGQVLKRTKDEDLAYDVFEEHVATKHRHYHLLVATDGSKRTDSYDGPIVDLEGAYAAAELSVQELQSEGWVETERFSWVDKLTPMEGLDVHLKNGQGRKKIVRTVPCLGCRP